MKKGFKLVPFALAALMLVGCSSRPIGPSQSEDKILNENTLSFQEFYDEMYSKHNGSEQAAKQLILRVAKETVNNSETFKGLEGGVAGLVKSRQDEILDKFYSETYKVNGYFDEGKLVEDLKNKGYDIKPKDSTKTEYYKETSVNSLLRYDKLHTKLNYDYSDYLLKNSEYDIYLQLLKEEYILSQKPQYFEENNKRIRKVQYFSYTPDSSSQGEKIQSKIESAINAALNNESHNITAKDFETLAKTTFQDAVNEFALDTVAKEYAIINENPTTEAELLYKDKFLYKKYIDEITAPVKPESSEPSTSATKKLTDDEKNKVEGAINSYTNNGAYKKEYGYLLKQINVYNNLGYHEGYIASDDNSSTLVQSDIDSLIKKSNLNEHLVTIDNADPKGNDYVTNILDGNGANSCVFKKDSSYYVVRVEVINENTKGIERVHGANTLTKNTTNVKNAVAFYLEKNNVNIHEESLYNYLKDTFGYNIEK